MRRTFRPNRISQRFRAKKRFTGLKFTPILENCRLCIKIVQNVLFRPCWGRFDQSAFFNVCEPKIALPDWNSRQYVKIVQNVLFKRCGGRFDQIAFWTFQIQKSPKAPKLTPTRENSRLSMKIVQNVLFRQCGGRFGQIVFLNLFSSKIAPPDWNSRQYLKTVGFVWKL